MLDDIREEIIEELSGLANLKDEELVRAYRLLEKVYTKLWKIGSEKIRIPVLRSPLKIGDRWLRFRVKRLKKSILEIKKKKNEFRYALREFRKGNDKPAKEVFLERRANRLALSGVGYGPDLSDGTSFLPVEEEHYKRLIESLGNKEKQ